MLISMDQEKAGQIRAVFALTGPRQTQLEFVLKINGDAVRSRQALSEVSKLIDQLKFAARPHSCAGCDWHDVMALIERCHREAQAFSCYASTSLMIDDAAPLVVAAEPRLTAATAVLH
ncbi:MAG: hypothetical protein DMF61_03600 [Blastocatellia bacterium AA13]|nr:MAG: hypothetical protein DMF61_03600 [Blastocatellia bacterium AA13]